MKIKTALIFLFLILMAALFLKPSNENQITLMATTTTQDSGLLNVLIPKMEKDTGTKIKVVAFGTGKVLRSAMDGNADIVLVHDPIAERKFMKDGFGNDRHSFMQNDFVIVGPELDPAGIKMANSATEAFTLISISSSPFISRGDQSGTHNAEIRLWHKTNLDPEQFSGEKYIITGSGMGRTLGIATEKNGYVLTDKATWLSYQNKSGLKILFENDSDLKNIYSFITVNANLFDHIEENQQSKIINWIKSDKATEIINDFKISGIQPFLPIQE